MAVAIQASANDFAETIIMPGDPLRAKFIAEHYLSQAREVNSVRNMLGSTGEYKGKRISVMAHGMVAGLYTVAAELGARALAILTTSDHIKNGGKLTIDQRQNAMHNMIELALETALAL